MALDLGHWLSAYSDVPIVGTKATGLSAVYERAQVRRRVLASLIAEYLEVTVCSLHFRKSPGGKPEVVVDGEGQVLHFSCSSSAGRMAVALSLDGPVGVDIEAIVSHADLVLVAVDQFTPAETAFMRSAKGEALVNFYRAWVAREAYVKLTGQGLLGIREAPAHPALDSSPELVRCDPLGTRTPTWLLEGPVPHGYRFALVSEQPLHDVQVIDLAPGVTADGSAVGPHRR